MPVLQDVIRDKNMQDVSTVLQAFRRRSEFSPACEYETDNHERCEKGWIYTEETAIPQHLFGLPFAGCHHVAVSTYLNRALIVRMAQLKRNVSC